MLYKNILNAYSLPMSNNTVRIRSLTTILRYKAESNTPVIFDTELRSYSNGITVCIRTVVSIDMGYYVIRSPFFCREVQSVY